MFCSIKTLITLLILFFSGFHSIAQPCPWHNPLHVSQVLECNGSQFHITYKYSDASYVWSTGSTSNSIIITSTGWYWVDITKDGCTARDSTYVNFAGLPLVELGPDTTVCEGETIELIAGNTAPFTSYLWSNGSMNPTLLVDTPGTYWVKVFNGCTVRDTIKVSSRKKPIFSFGPDKYLCIGGSIWLNSQLTDASFVWQDGSMVGNYFASQPGLYYLTATNNCGSHSDSVNLIATTPPVVDLGRDTILCNNESLLLQAGDISLSNEYIWSDNSTSSLLLVNKAGTYWVKVKGNGCAVTDTIQIQYNHKPRFSLGTDKIICEGEKIELKADINDANLLWHDGSSASFFNATQPGIYFLKASNNCSVLIIIKGKIEVKIF